MKKTGGRYVKTGLLFGALATSSGAHAGPAEVWECGDPFTTGGEALVVATVDEGRASGVIAAAGIEQPAMFQVAGFDRRWDFGYLSPKQGYQYAFIIEPNGDGKYIDFGREGAGRGTPSKFMTCRKTEPAETRKAVPSNMAPAVVGPKTLPPERPPSSDEGTLLQSYRAEISRQLDQQRFYPKRALDAGWQGTTKVRVHLTADGDVLNVAVEETSGHAVLDDAALKMVKNLRPFPPMPEALRGKERTIILPLQFRIGNS
jgi:TonB family protein